MNIVEAYVKFNGQYVILISGFSGTGKTKLAEFISRVFDITRIDMKDYYFPYESFDNDENYFTLGDIKELDWDNIYKSIDWDKLNKDIDKTKNKGVVVSGFGFPEKLLKFRPDFHLHIKMNKQDILKNREEYTDRHPDMDQSRDKMKLIFNKITYPHYNEIIKDSQISKYIDTGNDESKIRDLAFKYLIDSVQDWLDQNGPTEKDKHTNEPNAFDEFFYDGRRSYDFNDQGIDYPPEHIQDHSDEPEPYFLYTSGKF